MTKEKLDRKEKKYNWRRDQNKKLKNKKASIFLNLQLYVLKQVLKEERPREGGLFIAVLRVKNRAD